MGLLLHSQELVTHKGLLSQHEITISDGVTTTQSWSCYHTWGVTIKNGIAITHGPTTKNENIIT